MQYQGVDKWKLWLPNTGEVELTTADIEKILVEAEDKDEFTVGSRLISMRENRDFYKATLEELKSQLIKLAE